MLEQIGGLDIFEQLNLLTPWEIMPSM